MIPNGALDVVLRDGASSLAAGHTERRCRWTGVRLVIDKRVDDLPVPAKDSLQFALLLKPSSGLVDGLPLGYTESLGEYVIVERNVSARRKDTFSESGHVLILTVVRTGRTPLEPDHATPSSDPAGLPHTAGTPRASLAGAIVSK
jgi:hypothetical protein